MIYDLDELNAKKALYSALKDIAAINFQGRDAQPWLSPPKSFRRLDTVAAKQGKRADQNGSVRNLKASDLGVVLECERRFGAAYEGIVLPNNRRTPVNISKGGTMFHTAIEGMLPDWIKTETNAKNEMYVRLPSIGQKTQKSYTNKGRDGITGMMDGYLPQYQTGLEIKSVPYGEEFPDELTSKHLGQVAGYAWGLNRMKDNSKYPVRWFWLYLHQDLRNFIPEDIRTYRFFSKTTEELEAIFEDILERAIRVANIIDTNGFYESWDLLACYEGDSCYCSN